MTIWGCTPGADKPKDAPKAKTAVKTAKTQTAPTAKGAPTTPKPEAAPVAKMGEVAPDFTLQSATGETVTLKQFRGKVVVLEWFNPDCPFVKVAHNEGKVGKQAADHIAKGGVWLAINSGAQGMQGHGKERNAAAAKEYGLSHPILLDEDGAVGKRYNALKTPHMYVIDAAGKLVYQGALDSTGGQGYTKEFTPHLQNALTAVREGKAPEKAAVRPWGCSVKYAL